MTGRLPMRGELTIVSCHRAPPDDAVRWIASRSLSSGAHSRDPVARNDGSRGDIAISPLLPLLPGRRIGGWLGRRAGRPGRWRRGFRRRRGVIAAAEYHPARIAVEI